MPLHIVPAEPVLTTSQLPVSSLYAVIESVSYTRRGLHPKTIAFEVAYYANEVASVTPGIAAVQLLDLPTGFAQEASPEQANEVPIFTFLETILASRLRGLLGEGATIENVA